MSACGGIAGVPTCVDDSREVTEKHSKQIVGTSKSKEIQVESQLEEKGWVQLINDSTDVPEI